MRKWLFVASLATADIENPGLVEPSKCEACKYFTIELKVLGLNVQILKWVK